MPFLVGVQWVRDIVGMMVFREGGAVELTTLHVRVKAVNLMWAKYELW